jgi:hypothetical protein
MNRLRQIAALVWEILREISDERAYSRHLEHHGRVASREEWRRFSDERLRARYARPKCC